MNDVFVKRGEPKTSSLIGEAAALRWLAEAEEAGGMPTVKVLSASERELVEQRVIGGSPNAASAERIGVALAVTHAAGAPWWGAPPPGWEGSYRIASSLTPTVSENEAPQSWGAFFAEWRVMAYLRQARDVGALTRDESKLVERVASRLQRGDFDVPQPGMLVQSDTAVARIHGDLWSGNVLWDADPKNEVGGVLIDPMAHGGHAETDLAMLALFGCPFIGTILSAYNEASPLAEGWRERVQLHQLAPLLHHCALFGRGYAGETLQVARKYS